FECGPSPHVATDLLEQHVVPKLSLRFVSAGLLIDSNIPVLLLSERFVEPHLFVEIALELPSVDEKPQSSPKLTQPVTHTARPPSDRLLKHGVTERMQQSAPRHRAAWRRPHRSAHRPGLRRKANSRRNGSRPSRTQHRGQVR